MPNEQEIIAWFTATPHYAQTCTCLLRITNFRYKSAVTGTIKMYGADVFIAWNKDNTAYSRVHAGAEMQLLSSFSDVKGLAHFIHHNHNM